MKENQKKLEIIKDAIDKRLRELYEDKKSEVCKEAQMLEYLMCLVEADPDDEGYATSCLIRMYD
ncbi:MAG: hypothetical protein GX312_02780 [Candidatus Phytoplasma sp.]|nr:hypothetical protein [Phytoplasma sp.]